MTTTHPNWRDHALNQALHAESIYGDGHDALLREIRQHNPAYVTRTIHAHRSQLQRFLSTQSTDWQQLVLGDNGMLERDETFTYVGWYAVEWRGARIEIALTPSDNADSRAICLGTDPSLLAAFVEALHTFVIHPAGRALRYARGWHDAPELDDEISKVQWEDLVLPPTVMTDLRDAVEGFFQHRTAYTALGFAWRRGILLVGPPGTGKTMVCKAAAAALSDLPFLYVRDLGEYHEQEAIKLIFERARKLAPCILAFEDIDGLVIEGQRTVFLNELDGFQNNEGLLIIASSNHPGKIDEALLKRPSRFDRVFHLGLPAQPERLEFCLRVLSRSTLAERIAPTVDLPTLARTVAERTHGFTHAYLKEAFTSAALQRAQAGAIILDEHFEAAVLAQVNELKQYLRRMRDPDALAELSGRGDTPFGFRR